MSGVAIDSSALIAMLELEPEAADFARAIEAADERVMSAFTLLEASVVIMARRGFSGRLALEALRERHGLEVQALTLKTVAIALDAWERFGKGRHPAGLNIGDCCSYAVARETGHPLLFKGNDFSKTDLVEEAQR